MKLLDRNSFILRKRRYFLFLAKEISQRKRKKEELVHYYDKRPSIPHLIVPDIAADERDVYYAERLLKAYHSAMKEYSQGDFDLWTVITGQQSRFLTLLNANNPVELAQYLCNMNKEDATSGIAQGDREYERITSHPTYRYWVALVSKDSLTSLAEAVGALPVENPEQGHYGKNIHEPAESLFKKICASLGYDITPPPIDGGLLKIPAGDALFHVRDCNAIYTASLVKSADKICEIGGGVGRVCFWSKRFGVKDYTVVDLPHVNVVQGYYLLKALSGEVSLFGETDNKGVRVLPCHRLPEEKFDLVLNQDSFTEIGKKSIAVYLQWIRDHASEFLSINHESKPPFPGGHLLNVFEETEQVGGLKRISRMPYWIKKGYMIEKYVPL